MKHVIIGTAGHVDHGKTALVRALTGVAKTVYIAIWCTRVPWLMG